MVALGSLLRRWPSKRCFPFRHGLLPDSDREKPSMRRKAGGSMMATRALSTPPPIVPPRRIMRPSRQQGRRRAPLAPRTRRGRTSMPELPVRGRQLNRSERIGKRGRWASLSPRRPKPGGRTTDATDTAVPENRSRGRSQTVLYNVRRLHQALGYRAPMAVWREGAAPTAHGHVDNASALTTCPQADPGFSVKKIEVPRWP
jgi:hypothetical protein